jgi:hypothetical protein
MASESKQERGESKNVQILDCVGSDRVSGTVADLSPTSEEDIPKSQGSEALDSSEMDASSEESSDDLEMVDESVYLSPEELFSMQLMSEESSSAKLREKIMELEIQSLNQKEQILTLQMSLLQKDRALVAALHSDNRDNIAAIRNSHREKNNAIRERLGLTPEIRWGFDPDSGKVITD